MTRIQPAGPYYLLAYSFGSIVANEIARQLSEKHRMTVQSLILIDPPIPVQQYIIIPQGYDENQFWYLRTIGLILSYFNRETNPDDIFNQIMNSSLSNEQKQERIEDLMRKVLSILKSRFSQNNENHQISTYNHDDTKARTMFEVIKTHTIAKESYTIDSARNSTGTISIKNAIMFTLNNNNKYTSSHIKRPIWESLLPNLI